LEQWGNLEWQLMYNSVWWWRVSPFEFFYYLTYLFTLWSSVLLEKLTGLQLVKKFPAFYGTRRFITALTSACHLSLSLASLIQSTHPHPTSWRSIIILSPHLRLGLPQRSLSFRFPHQNPIHTTPTTHTRYIPRPAHPILLFTTRSKIMCFAYTYINSVTSVENNRRSHFNILNLLHGVVSR
jgi:hypothetical protein